MGKPFGSGGTGPRIARPQRGQRELLPASVDELIDPDHRVRAVWKFVTSLDLSEYYGLIEARGSTAGRPATDPAVLVTLWVCANIEGVGSARLLERMCERDIVYRWICGGVGINHHTLSDFRTKHGAKLDALLTQVIGRLTAFKIVTMRAVAQDGTKVRADAGASSFRREETLQLALLEAQKQVETLRKELDEDPAASSRRLAEAKAQAAEEQQRALEAALAEFPSVNKAREVEEKRNGKRARKKGAPRVSTTDPEARVMKMADGGYRPAFNVQLATDVDSKCIVGVVVTNAGTDNHQVEPVVADILNRTGELPQTYLVDGGFRGHQNIEGLAAAGVATYAPVPKPRRAGVDPHAPRAGDSPEIAEWRRRMGTDEAKEAYKERAATAERVNADLKQHRGLNRFNVRGLKKVTSVVLLAALSYNIMQAISATAA